MRTNVEKYNHWQNLLKIRVDGFLADVIKEYFGGDLPTVYQVKWRGGIKTLEVTGYSYNHRKLAAFPRKKPTRVDVLGIKTYYEENEAYRLYDVMIEVINREENYTTKIGLMTILKDKFFFTIKEDAEVLSEKLLTKAKLEDAFLEANKQYKDFDYLANGYNFLGWQESAHKMQDYKNCRAKEHTLIELSLYKNGMEHIVSCPLCKIYWKYDSSG